MAATSAVLRSAFRKRKSGKPLTQEEREAERAYARKSRITLNLHGDERRRLEVAAIKAGYARPSMWIMDLVRRELEKQQT